MTQAINRPTKEFYPFVISTPSGGVVIAPQTRQTLFTFPGLDSTNLRLTHFVYDSTPGVPLVIDAQVPGLEQMNGILLPNTTASQGIYLPIWYTLDGSARGPFAIANQNAVGGGSATVDAMFMGYYNPKNKKLDAGIFTPGLKSLPFIASTPVGGTAIAASATDVILSFTTPAIGRLIRVYAFMHRWSLNEAKDYFFEGEGFEAYRQFSIPISNAETMPLLAVLQPQKQYRIKARNGIGAGQTVAAAIMGWGVE